MANKVITMQLIRTILQALEKGFSLRHISRELKSSRKTVTLYVSRLQNSPYSLTDLRSLDDASLASLVYSAQEPSAGKEDARRVYFISCMPYFLSELRRTGVTRLLIWPYPYDRDHKWFSVWCC